MIGLGFFVSLVGGLVIAVTFVRYLHLPAMIGYLLVGIVLSGILNIQLSDALIFRDLAEFGIALLLFTMGLEFNLEKLRSMRHIVFKVGFSQVLCTGLVAFLLSGWVFHLSWKAALLMSFILSMSSTAIVGKMLVERGEVHSSHGYEVLGIALFQDIAIVPMLIILPALGESGSLLMVKILQALVKSVLVLFVILKWGRPIMHRWFAIVSRGKSHEIFLLNIFFVSMGLSYLTHFADLPMELGAFLAGMLISNTEYQHEVEKDISPFRDIFLGIFFVTLGMYLDLSVLFNHWLIIGVLVILLMLLKFLITFLMSYLFNRNLMTASKVGLWLCSAGEFSFVMLSIGEGPLIHADMAKTLVVALVVSMILVTILIQYSHHFIDRYFTVAISLRERYLSTVSERSASQKNHAIIVGFGRHGQFIARVFEEESIHYTAIDLNEERVRCATTYSGLMIHGDAKLDLLRAAGLERASALVVVLSSSGSTQRVIEEVRKAGIDIPIIARVSTLSEIPSIVEAGANEVVPEILETGLLILSHAMTMTGLPMYRVRKMINRVRAKNYELAYSLVCDLENETGSLLWWQFSVPDGAAIIGQSIDQIGFIDDGMAVRSVLRGTHRFMSPSKDFVLAAGDILIVLGRDQNRSNYIEKGFLVDH